MDDLVLATDFLSPERIPKDVLAQIRREMLAYQPLARLLEESPVPLVILNGFRQMIYANPAFLRSLDTLAMIEDQDPAGMRPGEFWHCMQAENSPAGCGTSYACRSCHISNTLLEAMKWGEENDWERIERLYLGSFEIEMRAKSIYLLGQMVLLCRFGDEPYRSPVPQEVPASEVPASEVPASEVPEEPRLGEAVPATQLVVAEQACEQAPCTGAPCAPVSEFALPPDEVGAALGGAGADMEAMPTPDRLAEATRLAETTHLAEARAPRAARLESLSGGTSTPDSRISDSWPPQALPPNTPIAVAELYTFLVSCGEF